MHHFQMWSFLVFLFLLHCCDAGITPLHDVLTDTHQEVPVSFDLTSTHKLSEFVAANATCASNLTGAEPTGYAVVGATLQSRGSPANVLIQGARPLSEGINQWRFIGINGTFGCGVSDRNRFGSGWKLSGLYLTSNGNLAGRGALRVGFVQDVPRNPTVDWMLQVAGSTVDVYLMVNGVPRGHAFHLSFPDREAIKQLRPMLSFSDESHDARAVVLQYETLPLDQSLSEKFLKAPPTLQNTKWRLEDAHIILTISRSVVSVRVANVLRAPADFKQDGTVLVKGPVASTMMMPLPGVRKKEQEMARMLETMTHWSLNGNILTIESEQGKTIWLPHTDEPVVENPFIME
eukprot:Gregarina_sp_Pseudo_9__1296@NODE_1864_length_1286_cov_181_376905_g1730_i0_p1_GENE_NODE_1864_length_1286_cov_181_376905_g1730_i0NODE_1864_length_1286_cov_181_376905_g1730_i0_p1_ORF_typecomplete_len356_score46_32META/PF03724_16/8_4e03META/PF03724_16/7_1e10Inh/PF02974_14/2_6e02Inh/PF02974_14/1_4e03Inh/PF02974_14/12_NODE_1864_length_1286_cov_181_376905_g1730_i02171257